MSKVAVVYFSSTGNTEMMAQAVAKGAKDAGAETDCVSVSDVASLDLTSYDGFALGCSAMGNEELDDGEFRPFFEGLLPTLKDKKVVLFGSFGWGDGEWMRNWKQECEDAGVTLAGEPVICQEAPDEEGTANCEALGKLLA